MIDTSDIRHLCLKHFNYLKTDYDFEVVASRKKNELCFKTDMVGVRVEFDSREFYLFVTLCKLKSCEFPPRPRQITPNTQIDCFDLDDVVTLRSAKSLIPSYESIPAGTSISFEDLILKQAKNLQNLADDILRADFSLFKKLDKIVKNRARQSAIRRWGKRAADYGWSIDEE